MAVEAIINVRDGEEVLLVVRRYWITMLPHIAVVLVLLLAPFFFAFPLLSIRPWGSYLIIAMLLLGIFLAVRMFVQWYFTMFIVTSLRVVDVYHKSLFDRQVTDAGYDVIQDVSYRKKGLVSMLFDVGSITIQTAGSNTSIEIGGVNKPQIVLASINGARGSLKTASPTDPRKRFEKMIDSMDEDDVRDVMKVAVEKKRKRAATEFFSDDEDEK